MTVSRGNVLNVVSLIEPMPPVCCARLPSSRDNGFENFESETSFESKTFYLCENQDGNHS